MTDADPMADRFCELAVLGYTDEDGPERWQRALDLLNGNPAIPSASVYAAAAAADPTAMARQLADDPDAAGRPGGPKNWEPLLYLTYSRLDPQAELDAVLTTAQLLLDHGADPNAGFLWEGEVPPFTALTGVFGCGEQGPTKQPPHPHHEQLARLLLDAGAEPNDGQALYNRMFDGGTSHLELLFEYGLGTGDGGPWAERLPVKLDSPELLLQTQLFWAVAHGMAERIELLAAHGVDVRAPVRSPWGQSFGQPFSPPMRIALLAGRADSVRALRRLDVPASDDPVALGVFALINGEKSELARLTEMNPGLLARIKAEHPRLALRAVVADQPAGLRLLAEHGFDLNAKARGDLANDDAWETPLHHAAGEGKTDMVKLLLELGADPTIRDRRFRGTALDWAQHGGHPETTAVLTECAGLR